MKTMKIFAWGLLITLLAAAAPARNDRNDEFFIVSSIDAAHSRLILKRPTDVTVTVRVTAATQIRDEHGQAKKLADLRAGDTAWITATRDSTGELTAMLVRLGPMTVEELQRRYLSKRATPCTRMCMEIS
ncbi:MAG TPA: hypothetical protein VH988_04925 [Thermoanaerobaculia bacterium]|nr:hypothetical protein [Thermoanaerobaculia bacterium]